LTDGKMRKMVASWKFSRNKQQFFSKRNEDKKTPTRTGTNKLYYENEAVTYKDR
jgi:hypothetical protein